MSDKRARAVKRPRLQVVEQEGEVPQMYTAGAEQLYPEHLLDLTDKLHASGHVELGLLVMREFIRYERLLRFAEFMAKAEE